jgi:hypothetical protein
MLSGDTVAMARLACFDDQPEARHSFGLLT